MAYTYSLGNVKPWVKNAAYFLGPKFGITLIYGVAAGQYDHPKGLALDFMISNIKNGKAVGDQLATYAVANYRALNITYVIWYRRIWTPAKGWHTYSGVSPHTDHVHTSYLVTPTSNSLPIAGTIGDVSLTNVGNPLVPDKVEQIYGVFERLNNVAAWVQNPGNLKRLALWSAGGACIWLGIFRWDATVGTVKSTVTAVKGAVANGS